MKRRDIHWRRLHVIIAGDIWWVYIEVDGIFSLAVADREV
jgi:hypothetical protein